VKSGYLITAPTIAALALQLSLDPAALEETIRTFTADATRGEDLQFHKGASSYNRAMGDASAAYPCLAPLVKPPFFAVRVHTGDLGSARGLVTDAKARVLRADGSAIAGLYAVGNDMNSMTAGHYPGPGITLGPALTFAYLAARDIAQRQDDKREETRQ
jgi:predicted oxidoreductase